jgi:hypothetical protein
MNRGRSRLNLSLDGAGKTLLGISGPSFETQRRERAYAAWWRCAFRCQVWLRA